MKVNNDENTTTRINSISSLNEFLDNKRGFGHAGFSDICPGFNGGHVDEKCANKEGKKPKKHFKLTDETKEFNRHTLHRIQCIEEFKINNNKLKDYLDDGETITIKEGELGGFVESEDNLIDNAWVCNDAMVCGNAVVRHNAIVAGNAIICNDARVSGDAIVYKNAVVSEDAQVYGEAMVLDNAVIRGFAKVAGDARVYDYACVEGKTYVSGKSEIFGEAHILRGNVKVEDSIIGAHTLIEGEGLISKINTDGTHNLHFRNDIYLTGNADFMCFSHVGSRLDTLTAYRTRYNGVRITTGCFFGDLTEFRKEVAKKDGKEAIMKKEYEMIADIIQHRFIDNNTENYIAAGLPCACA